MKDLALILLALACFGLVTWRVADRLRRRREPLEPTPRRILFPFIGRSLSQPALDATIRLARAGDSTLVPAFLAQVPMSLPLAAALPRQCEEAMPLLEAIEQRAIQEGVPVDSRIERGRTYRHALRELVANEQYDRIVIAAATHGTDGFDAADVAWLLDHADGEILVLRPAHHSRIDVSTPRSDPGARPAGLVADHQRARDAWPTTASL